MKALFNSFSIFIISFFNLVSLLIFQSKIKNGNGSSDSSFYFYFSYSVILEETVIYCGLEGLFLCKSVPS